MAAVSRDQALSLLAAANNHGDLAVKLSSLKQVRGILSSADPSLAAELFPYLVELQSSPESLVRKSLIETIEDIGLKAMEHSSILMPVLLAFLRDGDSGVAGKSIVCGTNFFCRVLEEITMQFRWHGKVERWLEELWTWMVRFKDAVFAIALEPGLVGTKLLALKFLETHVLLFTSDSNDFENFTKEGSKQTFNISWLSGGHPFLDPVSLTSEANRMLGTLMDLLQSACNLPGSVIITVVNCLAAIGRKRPLHHNTILSALLDFNPNFETGRGCHAASVQYSLRTAFLGFLRCTNPTILESRDRLLKALRAINAGDTADQVVRQVDKMIRNSERARENRVDRNDQPSTQLPLLRDLLKKRSMPQDNEERNNGLDVASKRVRYGPNNHLAMSAQMNESWQDSVSVNGVSPSVPLLDSDLNPVEQMIAMIAALLAEGERGAESLELLISNIHPDLLADIVISNMKHLHKTPPPLTRLGNLPVTRQIGSLSSPAQVVVLPSQINTMQSSLLTAQVQLPSSVAAISSSLSDTATGNTSATDSKRDPRRDPRRLDPRRVATPVGVPSISTTEDAGPVQSEFDDSSSITRPPSLDITTSAENLPAPLLTSAKSDDMTFESPSVCKMDQPNAEEGLSRSEEIVTLPEVCASSDHRISSRAVDEDSAVVELSDVEVYGTSTSSLVESDQHTSAVSNASAWEETCKDLPPLPLFVELTEEEQKSVRTFAVERIFESYKHLQGAECSQTRMGLLARLIAQANEDIVMMLQKYVVANYQEQKGHELVLHILYHLQSLMISSSNENSSYAAAVYEKLLLAVAKSLLDTFPASDKSFSRLLGEVPVLPDSVLQLLDDLCSSAVFDLHGKEVRDGERVTQGLGAVWSLILGRPYYRQACLDIALKSAAHSQDEIRAKAIRLVSNKLYQLSYITENIEQYATNMMLSAVNQHSSNLECSQSDSADLKAEGEVGSQETSISGSQVSEPGTFEMDSVKGGQPISHSLSTISFPEAQRLTSLFFALCTKKPRLLQLIFDKYVQAPKSVKQAFHRHIPILIRALGSSCSELLHIISDPPQGSENLLTLVLQILTQETTPSSDLIATVKHLYETKLKDATILIPMLSSLTKNEVLPIFPRLVDLPLEKFQMALAHILQGSAHTGPALTPVEVLVAIHDIVPEREGLALKKITDACSACFEQRTVFTQQVLAKALNQMVDQTPLPLLFMRTVIQAIDAFPTLVDFVMEILSKLVSKQVWRMPKLWVGFLKCVSQTRPHSFPVLLKLPPPQLESALNKYANLRGPLATYASQPSLKSSIPRSILAVLGLANESHMQQLHISSLNPSDTGSSEHGATPT
ncbi:Symplekin [Citrus sinensis]|uniref:Symplekin n=1 Tax=Citrus sinensis TaxID=2711 RepID=A0ACB8KNJ9_CITSI|nr:Symplekin [Citrus sinensis]